MPQKKAEEAAEQQPTEAPEAAPVPVAASAPDLGQIEADNYNRAAPEPEIEE